MEYNSDYHKVLGKTTYYRIPNTDRFVVKKVLLNNIDISFKEYCFIYLFNLPKDENGEWIYPKCENPDCNNPVEFHVRNFKRYCCKECSRKGQAFRMKSLYSDPNSTFNSEDFRIKLSEGKKRNWADPDSGFHSDTYHELRVAKIKETCNKEEFKSKQSIDQINRWKNEDYRKKHELINKEITNRPETRFKQSEVHKELWKNPNSVYNSKEYRDKLSSSAKISQNSEEVRNKVNIINKKPEVKERRSKAVKELWTRPEFVENQIKNNPFYCENKKSTSKISLSLFNSIKDKIGDKYECLYGLGTEYIVHTGRKRGDITSARLLDFYIPSLNKWIEFNGDYWHRNPKCAPLFRSDPISAANSWHNDRVRIKSISNVIGTKPLVIWESDYISDPNKILNKCIDYILNKE